MKFIVTIVFFLSGFNTYSQSGLVRILIKNYDTSGTFIYVKLLRDTQVVAEGYQPFNAFFSYAKLEPGEYKLVGREIASGNKIQAEIIAWPLDTTDNIIAYPGPCLYACPKNYKPSCPYGHSNNIIPIVYGMPGPKLMEEARKGHVYLGGCIISECDPHYYCKIHKLEL